MKKALLLFALLLPLAARANTPADGAFWDGEASPGRLVDGSGNGHNLTQQADPGNPTTPSPVFSNSRWLSGGGSVAAAYIFPADTITDFTTRFVIEFGLHDTAAGDMIVFQANGSGQNFVIIAGTGSLNISTSAGDFLYAYSTGSNHHIRIQVPNAGETDGTVNIDGVVDAQHFERGAWVDGLTTRYVGFINGFGPGVYQDGVMIGQTWSAVYPGPQYGTPTMTPTPSRTATASPTRTPCINCEEFVSIPFTMGANSGFNGRAAQNRLGAAAISGYFYKDTDGPRKSVVFQQMTKTNFDQLTSTTGLINGFAYQGGIFYFYVYAGSQPANASFTAKFLYTANGDLLPTPTPTPTISATRTRTPTITPTWSQTATNTRTVTPTFTVTPTWTKTQTRTVTPTMTQTLATKTKTPVLTATPTFTITMTSTITVTRTITITSTRTPTP